jgi:hypothetical protein
MKLKFKHFLFHVFGLIPISMFSQQPNIEAVDWIRNNAMSPDKYIIEKFRNHDIVLLGETHIVKENLLFVQDLIPKLYQNGVFNLGMEFGASEFQKELDELVNAKEYDEGKAKAIMFAYNVAWGYREYLDVYRAAWKLNRSLPAGARRFRILNLSYVFDWGKFNGLRTPESMKLVFHKGTADKYRAEIIVKEIMNKDEKILVLVGTPHAYTRYGSPYFKYNGDNFCDYDFDWLGNRLYKKYPEKVFNIILHQAFTQKENNTYYLISPAGGAIERLMGENANKPAGFDLINTPAGKLPDNSTNSMCYENFTLEQFFDGYIFLEPLRALEGCTVMEDFVNEQNFEYALKNFPDPDWHDKIVTLDDMKQFIKSNADRIPIQYEKL